MEQEKIIITSRDGFSVIRVINKMGVKQDLINLIKGGIKSANKQKFLYKELYRQEGITADDEITKELVSEMLAKHKDIEEELAKLNESNQELGMEIVFMIIENITRAEEEVYDCMAKIYKMKKKEVEALEIDDLVTRIMGIVKSESFQRFFTSIMK